MLKMWGCCLHKRILKFVIRLCIMGLSINLSQTAQHNKESQIQWKDTSNHPLSPPFSHSSTTQVDSTFFNKNNSYMDNKSVHRATELKPEHLKPSVDIVSICEAYATAFAEAASNYTRCFIVNARPLHLCTKCVNEYLIANKTYWDLERMTDSTMAFEGPSKIKNCKDWILNADRVMAIQQMKAFFETLWTQSRCSNCFSSYSWNGPISIAQHMVKFERLSHNNSLCFDNYTIASLITNSTSSNASKACKVCKDGYDALNNYYISLSDRYGDDLCMDIVDSMNYTRLVWGSDLHCSGNARQDGITIVITLLFFIFPAVFYIASHIHYQRIEKEIVKQKRMRRQRSVSGRSHGDNPDFLSSDSLDLSVNHGASTSGQHQNL